MTCGSLWMPKYFSESKSDLEHKPTKSFVAAKQESLIRSDWLDNFSTFKWAMNLKSLWKHKNEAIFLSPGGWRVLIKCFISGVQHLPSWSGTPPWSLGALFVVPANRAKRIQGSTMGPWGIGEMGDWITFDIFIPVRPMAQKYQLRCFFCCPSCWRPGHAKFWCIDPHLSFSWVLWVLCFDPRTFHQIFVNPEIDMRYKLNNLRCFFFGALSLTFHLIVFYTKDVKAQICTDVGRSLHSRRRHSQHSQHRQHLMFGAQQCPGPGLFGHNFQWPELVWSCSPVWEGRFFSLTLWLKKCRWPWDKHNLPTRWVLTTGSLFFISFEMIFISLALHLQVHVCAHGACTSGWYLSEDPFIVPSIAVAVAFGQANAPGTGAVQAAPAGGMGGFGGSYGPMGTSVGQAGSFIPSENRRGVSERKLIGDVFFLNCDT